MSDQPSILDLKPVAHRRKRGPGALIARWVGFSLVAVLLIGGGYAFYNYQRFVSGITHIDAIPQSTDSADDDVDGQDQNILLVGDDHRPAGATQAELDKLGTEDDGGGVNTDTMIVMHIPADGSKVTMVSFPRDSWVEIPGYGMNKLNAAFTLGAQNGDDSAGAQLLIQTIQNMTGLTIDHFVRVSLLGFYNVVDALGPVDVCLINPVKDPYSTIDLPAGVSTLDAKQALAFVRQRHGLPNGDLDRQVRQQYFLSVEARKMLSAGTLLNPVKLQNVLDAVSSSIETDPGLNLLELAGQVRNLRADNIVSATVPITGTPTITVRGQKLSIVEIDEAAMPEFIAQVVGTPTAYGAATAATPAETTVTVVNGAAIGGVAQANTDALAAFGFQMKPPTSGATIAKTTISYPAGQEAQAKALAAYYPNASVISSTTATGVTLTIGTDNQAPTDPNAAPPPATEAPVEAAPTPTPTSTDTPKNFGETACIN
jgi:LCP family protein required for cell wall assembly